MPHLRVMGILNVTPDSFSDGGQFNDVERALKRAEEMVNEGANIIDVGGYSTRPGHSEVSIEEEIKRVVPVVEAIRHLDVEISVDTFRSEVAKAVIDAGATMINDQWRGTYDEKILDVVKQANVPIILMHNNIQNDYTDIVNQVINDLETSVKLCKHHGIPEENIWLDPGIGFQKSRQEELELMKRLDEIVELGYPVLLAVSRKRLTKSLLNYESTPTERDDATAVATIYGIDKGVSGVRVHNVKKNRDMADIYMKLRGQLNG